jgi:hypothetical protein
MNITNNTFNLHLPDAVDSEVEFSSNHIHSNGVSSLSTTFTWDLWINAIVFTSFHYISIGSSDSTNTHFSNQCKNIVNTLCWFYNIITTEAQTLYHLLQS